MSVGTLTGNLTINAPANPRTGSMLVFSFAQDVTGATVLTLTPNSVATVRKLRPDRTS